MIKNEAIRVNLRSRSKKGRDATPSEIYRSASFQKLLRRLKSPTDPDLVATYSDSMVKRNWIPQAIGRRKKGRPGIRTRKTGN